MSDAVNFHFLYAQQFSDIPNSHIRKQHCATKFSSTYLSPAAQYLNRTKSIQVPPNTMLVNKKSSNNRTRTFKNSRQQTSLKNNTELTRSFPSNMDNLNASSTFHRLPITSVAEHERRFQPVASEINLNENNKSQGLVHTLSRSLKRNKEKFYDKQPITMKSCNSLSNCDQSAGVQQQTMTPTLLFRHKCLENDKDSCTTLTVNDNGSRILINHSNDDESEGNNHMRKKQMSNLEKKKK